MLRNPVFLINSQFELIEYSYGPSDDFSLQNLLHREVLMELDINIQNNLLKRHQQQPYQFQDVYKRQVRTVLIGGQQS